MKCSADRENARHNDVYLPLDVNRLHQLRYHISYSLWNLKIKLLLRCNVYLLFSVVNLSLILVSEAYDCRVHLC